MLGEGHLLIVTREFEEQESFLTEKDFEAMWLCLAEFDGLAFYNGGVVAGASQPHKHLQQVPVPLGDGPGRTPMDPILSSARLTDRVYELPELPFRHAATSAKWSSRMPAIESAQRSLTLYEEMREEVGCSSTKQPYNLLVTRDWMLMVPRSKEYFETISVNALGFAGSILVRNETELETVRERGPFEVLRSVSFPTTD